MSSKIEEIKKNVDIVDYARAIGLTPKRIGSYYTLKEHDSVRIDPRQNKFWRNATGEQGSVIDFCMAFTGRDLPGAIKELETIAGIRDIESRPAASSSREPVAETRKILTLPEKARTYKNVYAYLIKSRKIPKPIVDMLVSKNMLYQDEHNNCVFVSYHEGKPVFACLRGTNTRKAFRGDISGSDYNYGILINNDSKKLCVTESVIDAMSLMALREEVSEEPMDYLSISGVSKLDAIYNYLSSGKYDSLYIALDHDEAGENATLKIKWEVVGRELLPPDDIHILIPELKDWNVDLVARSEEKTC